MEHITKNRHQIQLTTGIVWIMYGLLAYVSEGLPVLGSLFVALIGGALLILGLRGMWKSSVISGISAEFGKSTADPLNWKNQKEQYQIGEAFDVELSVHLPKNKQVSAIEVKIVQRDRTLKRTTGSGQRIYTKHDQDVQVHLIPQHDLRPATELEQTLSFQIPFDSYPTLNLEYNRVDWLLMVSIYLKGEEEPIVFESPFRVLPKMVGA